MNFHIYRPWILVIEAAEPNEINSPHFADWGGLVTGSGYRFVYTNLLSRYYVAEEHPELFSSFSVGPDLYVLARDAHKKADLERELEAAREELTQLRNALAAKSD